MPALAVAALSARWLAESARRGGREPFALDLFGDVDTRRAARGWRPIGEPAALRIDGARFIEAVRAVCGECEAWIAGPGFEPLGDAVVRATRWLPLIGNDVGTMQRVRRPRSFFAMLDALGIPHPEVAWQRPADARGWLCKDADGSGGWHIRRAADGAAAAAHSYFQREADGRPMSALFVADGRRAVIVGIGEQMVAPHGERPFVYRGGVGPVEVPGALRERLQHALDGLAAAAGLRGIGSLDFLLDGDRFAVLEVNPRPSATMALYDTDFARGLVDAHLAACREGRLPRVPGSPIVRGESIVLARGALAVTDGQVRRMLALGCRDVPQPGTTIAAGDPVCSVAASGANAAAVRAALAGRAEEVLALLENRSDESRPIA